MTPAEERPSLESVLDAFSVETDAGSSTLTRYLRQYPEYADDLIDLSRELSRALNDDDAPLSSPERAAIDVAWSRYATAIAPKIADPFAALASDQSRALAQRLGVPRQVITALRERRVSPSSVPRRFLQRLAEAMTSSVAELEAFWAQGQVVGARSYKADEKPSAVTQVSFEQVLLDANVPAETRDALLAEAGED